MNSRYKRVGTIIFIALIVAFFVVYLRDIDYAQLSSLELSWSLLAVATLLSLAFRYWGVLVWRFILRDLGAKELPKFYELANVYAKAWMARYIPGTVAWIAGKVYMANKLGISKSRLTVSSILEGGVQVVASIAVSLVILAFDPRLDVISSDAKLAMVVLAVLLVAALYPPLFNFILRKTYRFIRGKEAFAELHSNMRATLRSFLLYSAGAVVAGSSYYFLTIAIYPAVGPESFWYIVGSFTLAGALGMATPFVPSGLGVRDGVQLVLLSIIMPKEIALAITVFSRLWSAVVDVLFYLVATSYKKITKISGQ